MIHLKKVSNGEKEHNHDNSISRYGCSSPSSRLKLINLAAVIDSETPTKDIVNRYHVKEEFMPTLRKILTVMEILQRNARK